VCHKPQAQDFRGDRDSPHKNLNCQSCHYEITAVPHTAEMLKAKAQCGTCHAEPNTLLLKSTHARTDQLPGDHPNCVFCHGSGNPHVITAGAQWTRQQKVEVCSQCHRQAHRMRRYAVDTDAVSSYEESFHGKTLLRFSKLDVAICTDCHRHHDVLASTHPESPVHRDNAAKTCGQAGCHQGAQVNFAMSGANHLRLKVKRSLALQLEILVYIWLTVGTIGLLIGDVALDLRQKVFRADARPRPGRLVSALVSASYLCIVAALLLAVAGVAGSPWAVLAAVGFMGAAFGVYLAGPRRERTRPTERRFLRLTVAQRVQHVILAVSFLLLVATGMPLKFANVPWLSNLSWLFGGIAGARILHRTAGVVLLATWLFHVGYLIYRWSRNGFSFDSWTMWPRRKDFGDFVAALKHYLGLTKEEPRFDRFQFREKFEYFAVFGGTMIMGLSGLVLWFPIYFGNRLPEIGLSFAYIAHSYEAVLAFLAITLWHFYNVIFKPDYFPMNPTWYTGTMTQSEMEREHPLELARLEAETAPDADPSLSELGAQSPELRAGPGPPAHPSLSDERAAVGEAPAPVEEPPEPATESGADAEEASHDDKQTDADQPRPGS
jgi:cytochrome b subunit of formate dehydrogenase